jgi:predicted lipoprotein with Yx(FWY)xxD motif
MRRKFMTGAAGFMALGIVLAACGDSSTKTAATGSTGATTTLPASSAWPGMSPAAGPAALEVTTDPTLGKIITDAKGVALYIYAQDTPGVSTCTGGCATAWPPLTATSAPAPVADITGTISEITRPDGSEQIAVNGQPLYYFQADAMTAGSVKGQGVGGSWYVLGPDGKQMK